MCPMGYANGGVAKLQVGVVKLQTRPRHDNWLKISDSLEFCTAAYLLPRNSN